MTITLGEAVGPFLASLNGSVKTTAQQEISKFVRWFGRERALTSLAAPEIGEYAELIAGSGSRDGLQHVEAVRGFLSFLHREGHLKENLTRHLATRKTTSRRSQFANVSNDVLPEVQLTREGFAQLQSRLELLKEERVRLAGEIKRAAADKDFRENAPLEAARERLGQIESLIREGELTLRSAVVEKVTEVRRKDRVKIGAKVTLKDIPTGSETTYWLVHSTEADLLKAKISTSSPLGKAILDRGMGEEVTVKAPRGDLRYQIVNIE
ncbi:MAG: transcription elongation factor GreA [Chloroflexi bacterium]|nr:transcription elongation factor GreA [Chloroflexota bacterium]